MRIPSFILGLLLTSTLACSSVRVNSSFDTNQDLAKLQSFAFSKESNIQPHPGIDADLASQWIYEELTRKLSEKGLNQSDRVPVDFLVQYNLRFFEDELRRGQLSSLDAPGKHSSGGQTSAFEYKSDRESPLRKGELVVTFRVPDTGNTLWSGTATGALFPGTSDESRKARVNEAVNRILEQFPPE